MTQVLDPNNHLEIGRHSYGLFRLDTILVIPIDIFDSEAAIPAFVDQFDSF